MNKENNKKSQYSKEQIANALFELLRKYPFAEISITHICNKAQIGRASFYRNFESKEDVVHYVVSKKLDAILKNVDNLRELMIDGEKFYNVFNPEKDFFILLFKNNLFLIFLRCLFKYTKKTYELEEDYTKNKYYNYVMGMITYQIVGMLDIWIGGDCKDDVHDFEKIMEIHPKILRKMEE